MDRRSSALESLLFRRPVPAREFLDPTRGIDKLLFASEKRMASGADADFDVLLSGTSVVDRTARAGNFGLVILRMDVRFHDQETSRELSAEPPACNR